MANFTFRGFKHNMKIQPVNINNNYSFQARKKEIKKADDIVRNVNLQFPALSTSYAKRYWHITNDKFKTSYKQKLLGFYEKINNCRKKIQRNEKEDKLSIKVFENVKKYKIANCGEKCHLTMGALSANGYNEFTRRICIGIDWQAIDKRTGEVVFSQIDDLDHTVIATSMTNKEAKHDNDVIIIDPWLNKAMGLSEAKPLYESMANKKRLAKKEEEFISDFIQHNKKDYGILGKKLPPYFNINDYEITHEFTFFHALKSYRLKDEDFKELGKVVAEKYPELVLK